MSTAHVAADGIKSRLYDPDELSLGDAPDRNYERARHEHDEYAERYGSLSAAVLGAG
ncbi:MAG: hypothetical protein H0V97_10715 [Actinobacteria bacterium]|nr:hypothetical protein [Actinomycetota bacterium]